MADFNIKEHDLLALLAALAPAEIPVWFQPEFEKPPERPNPYFVPGTAIPNYEEAERAHMIAYSDWHQRREKWRFLRWRAWFAQQMRGCAAAAVSNARLDKSPGVEK